MRFRRLLFAGLLLMPWAAAAQNPWRDQLARLLPAMGRHNWIVVADPAYPLVNSTGMTVVATDLGQTDLLTLVLDAILRTGNWRPAFYTDAELPAVAEQDAIGIGAYRAQLSALLKGGEVVRSLTEEQIMSNLQEVARDYRVLVLKSNTRLPYSSVYIQLDSGFWSQDAEKRLRSAMQPR